LRRHIGCLKKSVQMPLFQGKYSKYWSDTISSCHGDCKTVWSKLQPLLKPGPVTFSRLTADDFAHHFTDKIDRIGASTTSSPSPVITDRLVAEPLSHLRRTSAAEVTAILKKSAAMQCQLDPTCR